MRPLVAALVLALLASACADDSGSPSTSSSSPTAAPASTAPPPSGPPILLGFINMEGSPTGSFPEMRAAAEAAVAYVNAEQGGVGGRPLRLDACATVGTPESSQSCADRLVRDGVVAVIGGVDIGTAASLPVLEKAGIPYLTGSPTLAPEMTSKVAFAISGGFATEFLGIVGHLLAKGTPRSVSILYADLPGLLSTAARYAQQVLKLRGVQEVRLVPENPDAADFATAVTAATAGSPDAVLVGFPGQACARIMTTARALGVKSPFFYGSVCADDAVLKAAGKAADGARFAIGYRVYDDKADTEVAAYRRALDTYASGTKSYSVASEAGFSTVVNTAATLRDVGDPTASALLTALQATRDRPNFMGHPYTCDRKQVPLLGSVCNPWVRIVEYRDGGYAEVAGDWVSGAQLASGLGG